MSIRNALLVYTWLSCTVLSQAQSTLAETKSALEAKYKGHIFYIRNFPENVILRYDNSGKPVSAVTPGSWTLSLIEVKDIEINATEVVIRGPRIGLQYDKKKKTLVTKRIVNDQIQIHITLQNEDRILEGDWRNVLIPANQNITELLPESWKRFSQLAVDVDPAKQTIVNEPGVYKVEGDVLPPQPISTPDPKYSSYAKGLEIRGKSILRLIVGIDGRPQKIEVKVPLGMGLDEQVIKAIEGWRFHPATKLGIPVPVAINVEVNFSLY